jgi:Cu/Zn superoxide dismutase
MRYRHSIGLVVATMVVSLAVPALAGMAIFSKGPLADVSGAANPTDGAWAVATATVTGDQTIVRLSVKDLDFGSAGATFGAHVHRGPCVPGDGAAALGHYHHGGPVSDRTEVWLDFTVTSGGTGHATAIVPFAIPAGQARSVVIHALPTSSDGSAGARMACLPLEF